jgi:phosphate transport system protein
VEEKFMSTRKFYNDQLHDLRDKTIGLGRMVGEQLKLALEALEKMDTQLAKQVRKTDKNVNAVRFAIEEQCTTLIALQQPVLAGDLRVVLAMLYIIADLERMGDKAKVIAKTTSRLNKEADWSLPPEIKQMGKLVIGLLEQSLQAFAQDNIELAKYVISREDEVDRVFARLNTQIIKQELQDHHDEGAADFHIIRVARALERCGDLVSNLAERVIYIAIGKIHKVDIDLDDILEEYLP